MKPVLRLITFAAVVGVGLFLWVYQPWDRPSERAQDIVQGLRKTSVYVEKGAPDVVDAERAREVIDDRAIVVAVLDKRPLPGTDEVNGPDTALCDDIAALTPTNLVIVFAPDGQGGYGSSYCTGPEFPAPTRTDESASVFSTKLVGGAELAWKFRATENDRTAEIEEYVLAYDELASEAYGEIPTRGAIPDALATGQLVLAGASMVAGSVLFFLLLRYGAQAVRRGSGVEHDRSLRRQRANSRLNALADRILATPKPGAGEAVYDASTARGYIDALDQLEKADTDEEFAELEYEIDRLERSLT